LLTPQSRYQFFLTTGLLLATVVNNATYARNDSGSYRIPMILQALWGLILASGLVFLPETPRYFVMRGQAHNAAASLAKLRRLPTDYEVINLNWQKSLQTTNMNSPLANSVGWMSLVTLADRDVGWVVVVRPMSFS
jgi:MFS transporter, SP family, sugar:H+ symporter